MVGGSLIGQIFSNEHPNQDALPTNLTISREHNKDQACEVILYFREICILTLNS